MTGNVGWTRRFIWKKYGKKGFWQRDKYSTARMPKDGYGYNLKITVLTAELRKAKKAYAKHKTKANLFKIRALTEAINFER